MKVETQAIKLSNNADDTTVVKSCALFTFRALRAVAGYASQLPAAATRAATDVREAWEQSSRPNA